jgi:GT2 family glycosyltransferase
MNLGYAGGNNVGLRYLLAKDDCIYSWLLNNDTVIDKNALIEMVKLAESDEKIGIVGAKLLFYDETNLIEAIGGSSINLKTLSSHSYFEEDKGQWEKPIEPNYITAASVLVKKYLIDRIGFLDEAYFMYIEDVDWSLKAKSEGYKLNYCYKSMIWHKKGSSTGTSGNWSNFLGRKSSRPNVKKFAITYYYNIRNVI